MTKQPKNLADSGHDAAPFSQQEIEQLRSVLPEGRDEQLDRFVRFFQGGVKKWKERPFVDGFPRYQDYVDGDVGLTVHCHSRPSGPERLRKIALSYIIIPDDCQKSLAAAGMFESGIEEIDGCLLKCDNQHIVFVPVVDLGNEPNNFRAIFVGADFISNEIVDPLEGTLHRSLIQGTYHFIKGVSPGDGFFRGIVGINCAPQPHPAAVECRTQAENCIPGCERDSGIDWVIGNNKVPRVLIKNEGAGLSISFDQFNLGAGEIVDALLGPADFEPSRSK